MADLIIFNWAPWEAYVELNSISGIPGSPIQSSQQQYDYYPFKLQVPIDLSNDHGPANSWGKINDFRVKWPETSQPDNYLNLANPAAATGGDLLLWIFPDKVVFSQLNQYLDEVCPTH